MYLKDTDIYTTRLKRQHHQYQAFSKESSVNQQNAYLELFKNIKYKSINKIKIATDDFPRAYKKLINEIPILKESGIVYTGLKADK